MRIEKFKMTAGDRQLGTFLICHKPDKIKVEVIKWEDR